MVATYAFSVFVLTDFDIALSAPTATRKPRSRPLKIQLLLKLGLGGGLHIGTLLLLDVGGLFLIV